MKRPTKSAAPVLSSKFDRFSNRFSAFCLVFALLLLFLVMLYLSLIALCETVDMNMNNSMLENVEFHRDNFVVGLMMLALFILLLAVYRHLVEKVNVWIPIAVCLAAVLVFGIVWVFSSLSAPTHDSLIVSRAAYKATQGDYSDISADYFKRFPFQLGYVLFSEIVIRLAGTGDNYLAIEVVNVICLTVAYFALLMMSRRLFQSDGTVKLLAILMVFCFPPILFCTFTYGNIPGLMFACLALWQFVALRHEPLAPQGADSAGKHGRGRLKDVDWKNILHALLCAFFLGLAVCIKKNFMIVAAAVIIVALVQLVQKRKAVTLVCILLCLTSVWGIPRAATAQYEKRAGVKFGDGIPMVSWLSMGLNESTIAPGWYNGKYTVTNFHSHDMDPAATAEASVAEIKARLEVFSKDEVYANDFFGKKISSQWNEPTYQSLWTNQVRGRYGEMNKLASFVCGSGEGKVKSYMNFYQQCIFVLTAVAAVLMLRKKDARYALLPAILLGGFLYHALFEAKSQYAISYFILMLPLAAYAAEEIALVLRRSLPMLKRWMQA